MEKCSEVLLINLKKQPGKNEKPVYQGEYRFNWHSFTMRIFEKGVCVDWKKVGADGGWELPDNGIQREFYDAVRKSYLLYALCLRKPLIITEYRILRNGKPVGSISKEAPGFPFIFSMMTSDFDLKDYESVGGKVFGNRKLMDQILQSNRSRDQGDKKMNALSAYLLSKSREFESDRFLNLWTAINAVYNCICVEHYRVLKCLIDQLPDGAIKDSETIKEKLQKYYTIDPRSMDGKQLRYLERIIKEENTGLRLTNKQDKIYAIEGLNTTYKDYYAAFVERKLKDNGKVVYSAEKLYQMTLSPETPVKLNKAQRESQSHLKELEKNANNSLFFLLTFEIPYLQRNDYIHGNESVLLISDNYHLNKLACLNYFMDRFLSEFIPVLFDEGKMRSMVNQVHGFILQENEQEYKRGMKLKKSKESGESVKPEELAKYSEIVNLVEIINKLGTMLNTETWLDGKISPEKFDAVSAIRSAKKEK
ncbi:MAG: hypothetical protein K6E75_11550 [Lachnospiraceae bacterium]|nr:hypothetical protein [Lachnospiraceae bacterium]